MNKLVVQYEHSRYTAQQNAAIESAFDAAEKAHEGQLRATGEPYLIHPVAVAEIVAAWRMDYQCVMAALLHDVVEDTEVTLDDIKKQFGDEVAEMVDGVTKLRLSQSPRPAADSVRRVASNENLRKLLLATTRDYRVMMIKLADRLHNLRTLSSLPKEKRMQIARESLEVYAPLADRLGMGQLKGELEDLGFKFSKPEEYAELERLVKVTTKKAQRYLAVVKRSIAEYMKQGGVKVLEVDGRQKHIYSIYKKMVKVEGDIDKIYDLIATRIIVPDVAACYQALGILHQHYKPLIYRIKDYIAVPKPNGYQSLHTTVFADDGNITEIQIRTPEMHQAAEYGLAAHFFYDAQKATAAYAQREKTLKLPKGLTWVDELTDIQRSTGTGQEFVEGVRLELFADRIFVFSPKGDLYDLPEGATPVDFAFAIHSDIGLRALGARVNGKMVPLETRLENRDVVEIITKREAAPNRDWLSFVVTSHAKNRIRAWFRSASREANIASGKVMLEEELRQTWEVKRVEDLPKRAVADALDTLSLKSLDDLYAQIGDGSMTLTSVIKRLLPDAAKPADAKVVKRVEATGRVTVEGTKLPYTLAPCCNPVFPQPLIGYVTRGRGVTVHTLGCRNIPDDVERYTACRWETADESPERLVCHVELHSVNRIGLIADITSMVAEMKLNLAGISSRGIETDVVVNFGIEVPDMFVLARIIRKLERLPGVTSAYRVQ